jgi:hypothetical protein
MNEVVRPDMVPILRPVPHTGAIVEPHTASFRLFLWYLQTLTAPDTLHSLMVYMPAFRLEKCCDPTVTITAILAGQFNDPTDQLILVIREPRIVALC